MAFERPVYDMEEVVQRTDVFQITRLERPVLGVISYRVQVLGYWSSEVISGTIRREFCGENSVWNVEQSHSSGGRDTKELASDTKAERNFAAAMIALSDLLEQEVARVPGFEQKYKEHADMIKAKRQAAFDADPEYTLETASSTVAAYCKVALETGETLKLHQTRRGTNVVVGALVFTPNQSSGRVVVRLNGKRVAVTAAATSLVGFSARDQKV